jgi:hypothetical protein
MVINMPERPIPGKDKDRSKDESESLKKLKEEKY